MLRTDEDNGLEAATLAAAYDGFLADAGVAGIRQAVTLNSGLDAQPYLLRWPSGTTAVRNVIPPKTLDS